MLGRPACPTSTRRATTGAALAMQKRKKHAHRILAVGRGAPQPPACRGTVAIVGEPAGCASSCIQPPDIGAAAEKQCVEQESAIGRPSQVAWLGTLVGQEYLAPDQLVAAKLHDRIVAHQGAVRITVKPIDLS